MSEGALHFTGNVLAIVDGPELLVYGGDGKPVWKQFCEGVLVDVRVAGDVVVALDADGRLVRYRVQDGRQRDTLTLDGGGVGLDLAADGTLLVRTRADVVLVEGSSTRPLGQGVTTAAAIGPDKGTVGVDWSNGSFRAVDTSTGAAWGEIALGAPVTAVAWSPRGAWLVAAGAQIYVLSGDGKQVVATFPVEAPPSRLAAASDGVMFAAVVPTGRVVLGELHANQPCGHVDFRRSVGGLSWAGSGQLAIGLDDGDATRLDVFTAGSIRTEPHPGRGRNTWNYEDHLEKDRIRGAVAFARAGGKPIAKYDGPPPDKWPWWQTCLVITLVSFVTCTGCTGCSGLAYYLYTQGYVPSVTW